MQMRWKTRSSLGTAALTAAFFAATPGLGDEIQELEAALQSLMRAEYAALDWAELGQVAARLQAARPDNATAKAAQAVLANQIDVPEGFSIAGVDPTAGLFIFDNPSVGGVYESRLYGFDGEMRFNKCTAGLAFTSIPERYMLLSKGADAESISSGLVNAKGENIIPRGFGWLEPLADGSGYLIRTSRDSGDADDDVLLLDVNLAHSEELTVGSNEELLARAHYESLTIGLRGSQAIQAFFPYKSHGDVGYFLQWTTDKKRKNENFALRLAIEALYYGVHHSDECFLLQQTTEFDPQELVDEMKLYDADLKQQHVLFGITMPLK